MKVACIQPDFRGSKNECYQQVRELLSSLLEEMGECELFTLPERWIPLQNNILKNFQSERGEDYSFIKNLAKEFGINAISGAIWEKRDGYDKPFITSYYFNSEGEEIGRQDKLHLYSYERNHFNAGSVLKIFKIKEFFFSILICFDMAFFETPRLAAEKGADLLISPTQIREEGLYNWNIYLQARALENRIPVMACNSVGEIEMTDLRRFLGQSKIISYKEGSYSPSRLKIKEAPPRKGWVYDDIDLKFPRKLRKIRLNEKIDTSTIDVEFIT